MKGNKRYGSMETIQKRHETFFVGFQRVTIALMMSVAVSAIAVAAAVFTINTKPEPRYFATREDGSLLPLVAVNQPFLTDSQVTNFAVEAVTRSMTIDFANWRRDLSEASAYFTQPDGWAAYIATMEGSGILDMIRNRRLVASTVANGAMIIASGVDQNGVYGWTLQIPLTVTYQSSNESSREDLLAEVRLVRVPTWQKPDGIAISTVIASRGRAN